MYSVRDVVRIGPCRAENKLSNDKKYVIIGLILRKLYIYEHTSVGSHTDGEVAIYLLFIVMIKDIQLIMIIKIK